MPRPPRPVPFPIAFGLLLPLAGLGAPLPPRLLLRHSLDMLKHVADAAVLTDGRIVKSIICRIIRSYLRGFGDIAGLAVDPVVEPRPVLGFMKTEMPLARLETLFCRQKRRAASQCQA